MAISQQQAQRFNEWLEQVAGVKNLNCEVCKSNEFTPDIVSAIPQKAEDTTIYEMTFDASTPPVIYVALSCGRCGCTKFFDANLSGLVNTAHI